MRVYQFTEQPYPDAWKDHQGSLRVNLPNRKCDPRVAADLFHRYYDEWLLADELGYDIMLNEHHQTATCMSSTVLVGLSVLARQTRRARLLVLGYPIGHRQDPLRVVEELSTIDVISRGRLDMGFIKGVPYGFAASNQNPAGVMDRFWEAHDFIIKAMTSHDAPFNWESEHFHYRQVNVWPRPWQEPHPPVWSTTGSKSNARLMRGETPPRSYTKDRRVIDMRFASVQELIDAGILFCGTPDQVYDQIVDFCEYCGGMGNLLMMGHAGAMTHIDTVDNLTLFAKEVMPRLKEYKQPLATATAA